MHMRDFEKLGPNGNFHTLASAPAWLKADLALAAHKLNSFNTLVLFADDLPHHADFNGRQIDPAKARTREEELGRMCEQTFGLPRDQLNLDLGIANNPEGEFTSNALAHERPAYDSALRYNTNYRTVLQAPSHALIILPPQNRQVLRDLYLTTGLDLRLTSTPVRGYNLHRGTLWHELGHAAQELTLHKALAPRLDERNADTLAIKGCDKAGDQPTGQYWLDWRALSTFMSPINYHPLRYWNGLSIARSQALGHEEIAAYLEVKSRALESAVLLPKDPTKILARMGDHGGWAPVSAHFNQISDDAATTNLLTLAGRHKREPYKYPHSHELAEMVLGAAYRIAPQRFAACKLA